MIIQTHKSTGLAHHIKYTMELVKSKASDNTSISAAVARKPPKGKSKLSDKNDRSIVSNSPI